MKLFVVGNMGGTHIAQSYLRGASDLGIGGHFFDTEKAMGTNQWLRSLYWHFLDHRPVRLVGFSRDVANAIEQERTSILLATGIAPLTAHALKQISANRVCSINFLTDDPWNARHRCSWFHKALPCYDFVFSPRRSNLEDLKAAGCVQVEYLPFGYDHVWVCPQDAQPVAPESCDVVFVGGADEDRRPFLEAIVEAGFELHIYGAYWNRHAFFSKHYKGFAEATHLAEITRSAKVNLCLVRRANRDGHVMRSFEVPAMGGCMLTEDTQEHRDIFGEEGRATLYFRDTTDMIPKLRYLLDHPEERIRMKKEAHRIVIAGKNTYRDRLEFMLKFVGAWPVNASTESAFENVAVVAPPPPD